ncbi:hypothetical protein, partial [Tsukamurella pseudospumae]|uniref:hypothetical protein n=1 Tax=Tsukamurella pseudospumae TaxID=239498 RepID=UPI001C2F7D2B
MILGNHYPTGGEAAAATAAAAFRAKALALVQAADSGKAALKPLRSVMWSNRGFAHWYPLAEGVNAQVDKAAE